MHSRKFAPHALDVAAFAISSGKLRGRWSLTGMRRLADLFHAQAVAELADHVDWQADGTRRVLCRNGLQCSLRLRLNTTLPLICQRCLAPVEIPVSVDRCFFFVDSEDRAAQLDAGCDDDVLALTRSLDLSALAEDELLLAVPLVPRHESCQNPLIPYATAPTSTSNTRRSPFDELAVLKRANR